MCCVFFSWLSPRKVHKSEWLNIKRIIQFKMKVLYLFFHFVSFIVFSESCSISPTISDCVLQEAAARVPPVSSLSPLARAKLQPECDGAAPRALRLPQASRSEGSPGQSDQPDGCQGSQHQSVQWTFHLSLSSLSRHPSTPSPDQNVSTQPAGLSLPE